MHLSPRLLALPVLLLGLTAQASAPLPREGVWEETYEIKDLRLGKDSPPSLGEMIAGSFANSFPTETQCKGPDALLDFSMSQDSDECDVGKTTVADGQISSSMVCRDENAAIFALGEGTYSATLVTVSAAVTVEFEGIPAGSATFTIVRRSRRLGDCE